MKIHIEIEINVSLSMVIINFWHENSNSQFCHFFQKTEIFLQCDQMGSKTYQKHEKYEKYISQEKQRS